MAGLVPAIHVFGPADECRGDDSISDGKAWMAGTRPAMTVGE